MELYGRIRRAVFVEGKSQRAVAQEFGVARGTVRKMLRYSVPPGYRREQPVKRPKLGPWLGVTDAILENDKNRPFKQRHTAKHSENVVIGSLGTSCLQFLAYGPIQTLGGRHCRERRLTSAPGLRHNSAQWSGCALADRRFS